MNLITQTYDADQWQLVPRAVNPNMSKAAEIVYCSWLNKQSFKDDKIIIRYLFDALLAAAPQPETISPWRGIETAPKDGTPFLVSGFNYGNDYGERWHDIGVTSKKGAVVSTINANNLAFATHWMSLPQPPESK